MTTVEVFDPPMWCSTGVCGPEPDARRTRFAAIPRLKQVVDALGVEGLPVVVIDGHMVSQGEFPSREQLRKMAKLIGPSASQSKPAVPVAEQPPIFNEWITQLVALGASVASNCEPCFRPHGRMAIELGLSREDMIRAVNVAQRVKEQPEQAMVRLA